MGESKGKGKGKDKDKSKSTGKGSKVVWEFKRGDHLTPFQDNCQKFIEEKYQAFKYSGGADHIDRVKSGKVTFQIRFSEPMTSKVTIIEGKNVEKPWVDVVRSLKSSL